MEDRRGRTEHEGVWEERGERYQEAAETAAHVCELRCLARAGKGWIEGRPVDVVRGRRIVEGMVGEGVCVGTLAVVFLLRSLEISVVSEAELVSVHTWGSNELVACWGGSAARCRCRCSAPRSGWTPGCRSVRAC